MKKNLILLILTLLLFSTSGCNLLKQNNEHLLIPDFKIKEDLDNSIKIINDKTVVIEEKSDHISITAQEVYNKAVGIQSKITDENKEKINPDLETIKENSKSIIKDSREILKANMSILEIKNILISAKNKVKSTDLILNKIVKERNDLLEENKKILEQKNSQLHRTLQWLIVSCIVGCGAFIVLFFFTGSKGGLFAAGGCGLVLIITIFVDKYIAYLAIAGGIILLLMVGILIYNIYIKNKAFKEIVKTVEITQDNLEESVRDKIFGKEDGENGLMRKIQSPSTEKLVKKEKSKIDNLWRYAKNHKKGNLNGGG